MLGKRIHAKRIEKKITQERLGDMIGVSKWTIINWESGKRIPIATYLSKICSALGVSVNYILGEEDIFEGVCTGSTIYGASVPIVVKTFEEMTRLYNTSTMDDLYKADQNSEVLLLREYILKSTVAADKLPFAVIAEISCASWGIVRNSRVVINPAENVKSMDVALVRYYNKFALKKVRFFPDKSTELISEEGDTLNIQAEENTAGIFQIYGKAILALSNIIHGI